MKVHVEYNKFKFDVWKNRVLVCVIFDGFYGAHASLLFDGIFFPFPVELSWPVTEEIWGISIFVMLLQRQLLLFLGLKCFYLRRQKHNGN